MSGSSATRRPGVAALALAGVLFVVYNANGREIPSYDSQPTKFAARELLLRGTLSLNHVVGRTPALAERSGFVHARDGRYRSAYSPVPAIAASALAWPLWKSGLVDIRAPLAPHLIAAFAASALTAAAVALAFLTALRWLPRRRALLVAIGLGLGTGLWPVASQTLWQHETTAIGLALAIYGFTRSERPARLGATIALGAGLAVAGCSRPQVSPAIAVLLLGWFVRSGWRHGAIAAAITTAAAVVMMSVNERWYGTPLGAAPMLEALHATIHGKQTSWELGDGFIGLLVSPNRGLLVFSPVVAVAALAAGALVRDRWAGSLRWCLLAAAVQYLMYGGYAVWWGGHTFGPRYMIDILPLVVPLAAAGVDRIRGRLLTTLACAALAWSIAVGATGAFCYPHERWNSTPADVDRHHERLWDFRDLQIVRCWRQGLSPQNFGLFSSAAFRVPGQ